MIENLGEVVRVLSAHADEEVMRYGIGQMGVLLQDMLDRNFDEHGDPVPEDDYELLEPQQVLDMMFQFIGTAEFKDPHCEGCNEGGSHATVGFTAPDDDPDWHLKVEQYLKDVSDSTKEENDE